RRPADAELYRHHCRRRRVPHGNSGRRAADRCRLGRHGGVLAGGKRGGHVRVDGGSAAGAAARLVRRGRPTDVRELFKLESGHKLAALVAVWTALVLAPFWMPLLGGYTALGTRVLVLGLAAMSVNFLLGFTGVLSFGHAAWFGIGAYGCGMILKFIALSTPLGILAGTLAGGLAGAVLGALIVRRRRGYFAMVTIAFGQVFYSIAFQWSSVTGGDDGLRRSTVSRCIWAPPHWTSSTTRLRSIISCCSASRSPWRRWRLFCARPLAVPCWLSARMSVAHASWAYRLSCTSGSPSRLAAFLWRMLGRSMRWSTTSPTQGACITASLAIS